MQNKDARYSMPTHSKYPQDYPAHLSKDFDVGYCNDSPPAGRPQLSFEDLNAEQFEQLCWWLIGKDHQIVGCQRLGGPGKKQNGIDLFAFDHLEPSKLLVYECKCWEEFPTDELRSAITKFLNGHWVNCASSFTLIVAQKSIDNLSKEWPIQRDRLHKAGINAELLTGIHLTERIQQFPDVLSKFFPGADHTAFGNEWMRRVGFIERLNKALVDPRPGVVKTAKDYLETSDEETSLTVERQSENEWSLRTPWIHLSCILPHGHFYPGSALVILKREDLVGASITFDQKWVLENLIGTPGAPLKHEFRPFINGVLPDSSKEKERYIIDLKNCRCTLSTEGAEDLAYAADRLTTIFLDSLIQREKAWGASGFPFIRTGDIRIAICTMPKWLWRDILEFSRQHDYANGDTEWYFFDAAPRCLKPYTKESNTKYQRGYHGIFHASDDLDGLTSGDDIALLWSPPDLIHDRAVSHQHWWSCEYAFSWLKNQLIPEIGNWIARESFNEAKFLLSRQKRKYELLSRWKEHALIKDVRIRPLLENQQFKSIGLRKTVEILQSYFGQINKDFISTDEMTALYRALSALLKSSRGYVNYIAGSLSIQHGVESHSEIATILEQRISSDYLKQNSFSVDYTLRAMMEIIGNEDGWMSEDDKNIIFEALKSFMKHYDQGMLIKRHSKWI